MASSSVKTMARVAMQRLGYDPLEVLVSHSQEPNTSPADKRDIAMFLLPYVYPKLANVTMEADVQVNSSETAQAQLMRQLMSNPELADAAAKLSLAAAEAALVTSDGEPETGYSIQ